MPAPKGNSFARKLDRDRASEYIQLRCTTAQKKQWVLASRQRERRDPAMRPGLSQWVSDTLEAEAKFEAELLAKSKLSVKVSSD